MYVYLGSQTTEECAVSVVDGQSSLSPLGKRLHLNHTEENEDEGLGLGPCEKQRRQSDQELKSMSSEDLVLLRSQRHSTDAASDSGSSNSSSSGVYSDMEHLTEHHTVGGRPQLQQGLPGPACTAE